MTTAAEYQAAITAAFRSRRGDPNYNPALDFNKDGIIDGIDFTTGAQMLRSGTLNLAPAPPAGTAGAGAGTTGPGTGGTTDKRTDAERWADWLKFWQENYGAQQPGAVFTAKYGGLGANPNSPFAQYLQRRSGDAYTGFLGELYKNPNLDYRDYLSQNVDPMKEFQALAPRLRGERQDLFAPQVRWKPSPFGAF